MSRPGSSLAAGITVEALSADPHPILARLRDEAPVAWIEALGGWLVTRRDLCTQVMRDPEAFTVEDPRFSTGRLIGPSMLSLDGGEHRRHRQAFSDPFRSSEALASLEDRARRQAHALVGELAHRGEADLRSDLAAPLALATMRHALGLDGMESDEVLAWYGTIVDSVHQMTAGGKVTDEGREAYRELHALVVSGMEGSPLLSSARQALSIDEVVSNTAVLLFGGVVTVESTIALAFRFLLGDPHALEKVRADFSLTAGAVEETLRLEPSASVVDRYATRSIELGGAAVEQGDLVRVSLAAANRDPEVFPDPGRFDLLRPNSHQHLAFARGPHTCLGVHLARIEAGVALTEAIGALEDLHLIEERAEDPVGLVFRAPGTVWAAWSAPA